MEQLRVTNGLSEGRLKTGGHLVAPALDLVAVARQLGRLEELRNRVDPIVATNGQQRRSRLSMLALIDIAGGDLTAANRQLAQLAELVRVGAHTDFADRWPETLAISEAVAYTETRDAAREMAWHILSNQIRKHQSCGYPAWDQHVRAISNRLQYLVANADEQGEPDAHFARSSRLPLRNWAPASRDTVKTRGRGLPSARWGLTGPATVENVASHEDDYLFYRIPIRGNFEVECDVNAFGWRDTNLWVAGQWVGQVYTHRVYEIGSFRARHVRKLEPKLHQVDEWIRYRTVVRDGICTTYLNGRRIHQRALADQHDPWIAIRSPYQANGGVRNLRITGKPIVPAEVKLSVESDLPGWLPIQEGHRIGTNHKWRQLGDLASGGGIFGTRWTDLPGSHREALLRYHRPMFEDGTIQYEFFYSDGAIHVHPALDRLAFMLQPDGVRVHWITDDQYDRTELAADNLFDEPGNRRGPAPLPFRPDTWNRLQLKLTGDTIHLTLNEELIYERKLEPSNQRTFGLFHYADRTQARVRNLVWRGAWPRTLPAVAEQELAGGGPEFLNESLEALAATFHHDFAKDGLPSDRFGLAGANLEDIDPRPNGLAVTRPGGDGYINTTIAPHLTVHGDFDITASFEGFQPEPSQGGSSGVFLRLVLDNAKSNECILLRRHLFHRAEAQPIVQTMYVSREVGGARRDKSPAQVVEAPSGRLRLARRGDTVYYLFAENDSPNFRIVGKETATKDNITVGGVRLVTEAHRPGLTRVIWKSLTIRGEKIEGLALLNQGNVLAELDKQRDALPRRFDHDFANAPLDAKHFLCWGTVRPRGETKGLRIIAAGSDSWRSAGVSPQLGLVGDFDVMATFDVLAFPPPKAKQSSAFYLRIAIPDKAQTQPSVILVRHPDGHREVYAQVKHLNEAGTWIYNKIRVEVVDSIQSLRAARRGNQMIFVFRRQGSDREQILAKFDLDESSLRNCTASLMLRTGGAGRQSEVMLKHIRAHAEEFDPNPSDIAATRLAGLARQLTGDTPSNALEFDGRTQYVTIPSIRYDGSHPITLEAFITPDNFRNVAVGDTQQAGIGLGIPSQSYNMHAWNGKGYNGAVADGPASRFLRVHLAGTFDGRTVQVFVNGKLMKSGRMTGTFQGSGFPLTIGASPSPRELGIDYAFDGLIDQVRISNSVRYVRDFEVPKELQADDSTIALFRCNEGQGEILGDSSGNKHHGAIRGATWVTGADIRHRAALGLAELGRSAVPVLTEALEHQNPEIQLEAIAALGMIGADARSAVSAVKRLTGSNDRRVAAAATQTLGRIESKGIFKSILNFFDSSR